MERGAHDHHLCWSGHVSRALERLESLQTGKVCSTTDTVEAYIRDR